MSTPSKNWSDNDACLALDAALSDPWLSPDRRREFIQAIVAQCLVSPKTFQLLAGYGKSSLLAGEFAQRAYQTSLSHPQGGAFRAWLESQPGLEVKSRSVCPPLLTRSQQAAWNALEETADLYFSGELRSARIQPRTSRLIAGPSGVGKTFLTRVFAAEKGYAFMGLSYGEWLPTGSKAEKTTADKVIEFIANHDRCIIAIDELDKIDNSLRGEWTVSIQNDLYSLLDRTWFQNQAGEIKESVVRKFIEKTFFVGLGTWQDLWSVKGGARRKAGFGQTLEPAMADQIRSSGVIKTELLNRFNSEILLLEPMTAADFAENCRAEGLDTQAAELGIALDYTEAEASGLGMRWLEAVVLKVHVTRARRLAAACASTPPETSNFPDVNLERI